MSLDPYILIIKSEPVQSLKDINDILNKSAKSNGKVFLKIDSKTHMIGLTHDKDKASSMKEVAQYIHQIADSIGKEQQRKDIINLRTRVMDLENNYVGNRNFIQKLFDNILGSTPKLIKEINENLDKRLSDYGSYKYKNKKSGETRIRSQIYQQSEEVKLAEKDKLSGNVNQFAKIRDQDKISTTRMRKAFFSELSKVFPYRQGAEKDAFNTVNAFFDQGLRLIAQQTGELPQDAMQKFKWRLLQELQANNHVVLEMDRTIFEDLMGNRVKNLSDEELMDKDIRLPEGIDPSSSTVKQMIKDYKSGVWEKGEERTLEYDVMDPRQFARMEVALDKIFDDPNFQEAFSRWYNGLNESTS